MKKNNKLKFKIEGTVLVSLALALLILVNVVVGLLGEKISLKMDLTRGNVFTLAEETEDIIESLKGKINIYYATNAKNRNDRYYEILDSFDKASDLIAVTEINLDKDPYFSQKYQIESYNTVVVESEETGKKRVIDSSLIEQSLSNENGVVNTKGNYLESYISAAIRYSTNEKPLMAYIAIGHGEIVENTDYLDYIMNTLYSEGMSVKIIDFITDEIPSDADILIFAGPSSDFTDEDIRKLDDYLESGGRVQFYSNPSYYLPNFNSYLQSNWSASINQDCISDTNGGYIAPSASGNYLIPVMKSHLITNYFISNGNKLRVLEGETNSISISENSAMEINVLAATSSSGVTMDRENWIKKSAREPYNTSGEGEKNIIVYLRKNSLNNQDTSARLLLSGSYYTLFDSYYDSSSSYVDRKLFIKTINHMAGVEGAPISAVSKDVVKEKMEIFEHSDLVVCSVFLVVIIPVILFGYGIFVYIRRRRL